VKTLRRTLDAATADWKREVSTVQGNLATVSKDMEKWRETASKYEREINGLQGDLQQQSKQWQKAAESQGTSGVKFLSKNILKYYLSCFLGYLYFYFYFTTFVKKIMYFLFHTFSLTPTSTYYILNA
jgi:hypothetical protein